MAKVMMDSEIVEALATLAAHGIEAMKVKPKVLIEDAQWDPSILNAAGPGRPFEFNKIKSPLGWLSHVDLVAEFRARGIRLPMDEFSDEELRAELLRRGHQVPELGKGVKCGPPTTDEAKKAIQAMKRSHPRKDEVSSALAALNLFAQSRGLL